MAKIKLVPELNGVIFGTIITSTKSQNVHLTKLIKKIKDYQKDVSQRDGKIVVFENQSPAGRSVLWGKKEEITIAYEPRFYHQVGDEFENEEGEIATLIENIVVKRKRPYNHTLYDDYECKIKMEDDEDCVISETGLALWKKIKNNNA